MRGAPPGRAGRSVTWLSLLLLVYLGGPLVVFLARSAAHPTAGFSTPGLAGAALLSVEAATISLGIVAVLGAPLAYWLAHGQSWLTRVAGVVVQLPLALPPLMSGVVLLYVFGGNTVLGRLSGGRLTESVAGVVLAQSFVSAPFLVVTARSAFERVPEALEDVASTLGLGPVRRFVLVALPVAWPGVRAGLLLAWLRAFGEYGATVMMAYYPFSLPVFTYVQFSAIGLPATQAPSLISLAVAGAAVAVSRAPLRRLWPRRPLPLLAVAPAPTSFPLTEDRPPSGRGPVAVGFDLRLRAGSFTLDTRHRAGTNRLALVGPSGAGKSLTLRCLAGLMPGQVWFGDQEVSATPAPDRLVGYVPQGPSLMPHLRVWDNIMLGRRADPACAYYWLQALGLQDLAGRRPDQLSGGQRQRVALARALAVSPDLLLMDEPFTGLDAPQRASLLRELRRLQLEAGLSSVLVTHDAEEAALLADEVVVISQGRVAQAGLLRQVTAEPASPEVAAVLGLRNLRQGTAASARSLSWPGGPDLATGAHGLATGCPLDWQVHPRCITLSTEARPGAYRARVVDVACLADHDIVNLDLGTGAELEVEVGPRLWAPGAWAWAVVPPEDILVWGPPQARASMPSHLELGTEANNLPVRPARGEQLP